MNDEPSPDWPPGVHRIGLEDFRRLGIDAGNRIFRDGRRIEVRRRLDLTTLQKTLAAIVTACAVLGALGGFVTGFNNASVFLCARGVQWVSCPLPPSGTR